MDAVEIDPAQRRVLLDLFTEIAILEHLVRNRLRPDYEGQYTPAEFGLLNYFCRMDRDKDRLSHIAYSFETGVAEVRAPLISMIERGLMQAGNEEDPFVWVTPKGKDAFEALIQNLAPEVLEMVEGLEPDALRVTAETLKEIRRTVDNLPGR
jgi:DNA-binding MarR family transcriptional regulator